MAQAVRGEFFDVFRPVALAPALADDQAFPRQVEVLETQVGAFTGAPATVEQNE